MNFNFAGRRDESEQAKNVIEGILKDVNNDEDEVIVDGERDLSEGLTEKQVREDFNKLLTAANICLSAGVVFAKEMNKNKTTVSGPIQVAIRSLYKMALENYMEKTHHAERKRRKG